MTNSTQLKYSGTAQLLHWLIALLVVVQFTLVWTAGTMPRGDLRTTVMLTHVSVGFTVFVLALVRIGWRFTHAPPAFPASMSNGEQWLARITHWALYALIILMPLSGLALWATAGRDIDWFWLVTIPVALAENHAQHEFFEGVHVSLSWVLLVLAIFHVLAAIWHVVVKKDGLMKRMAPGGSE